MRKVLLFIGAFLFTSMAHAGVLRFTTKHVVVPVSKVSYRAGRATVKGLVLVGKTTAKVVY